MVCVAGKYTAVAQKLAKTSGLDHGLERAWTDDSATPHAPHMRRGM